MTDTHTLVELGAVKCRWIVDITAAVDSKQARVVGLIKKGYCSSSRPETLLLTIAPPP